LVIEPGSETSALKWPGTATVAQLEKLFEDGQRSVRVAAGSGPDELLTRADQAGAAGHGAQAIALYREALDKAPAHWPRRARAVESWLLALQETRDWEGCAKGGLRETPSLPPGPSHANASATGLTCALQAPDTAGWRGEALAQLEPMTRSALQGPGILVDDRSGIYELLVRSRESAKDPEGARRVAQEWFQFLSSEQAKAPTAEARAALDSHLLGATFKMGEPALAIPALQASERDLPNDYNPPARLAVVYRRLERYDEALAAAKRALAKVYGPRRIGVYETLSSIYAKQGNTAAARQALEDAIAFAKSLPAAHRAQRHLERLTTALNQLP
jgi:tetratricopeptide (TPR) repeat protein